MALEQPVYSAFYTRGDLLQIAGEQRLRLQSVGINSLAVSLGLGILAGIGYLVTGKTRLAKIIVIFLIIFSIVACMRTGTRSVFIGVPFSLLAGAIVAYKHKISRLILLILIFVAIFLIGYQFSDKMNLVSSNVVERLMTTADAETYSENGRVELLQAGWNYFLLHPAGCGFGCEDLAFQEMIISLNVRQTHNTYLSMLIQTSLPGFILLLALVFGTGWQLLFCRQRPLQFIGITFWVFLVLQSMKCTMLESRTFWLPLAFILICIEVDRYIAIHSNNQDSAKPIEKNAIKT